ncbi:MAG: tetratricopeptide repeat protein, partial [Anaerolineae bacterium]
TLFGQGDLAAARADLEQVIALAPQYAEAYEGLGTVSHLEGNPSLALTNYGQAIALDPQNPRFYYNRAVTYNSLQNYPAALADADRALALDPAYGSALFMRAFALDELNRSEVALRSYADFLAVTLDLPEDYETSDLLDSPGLRNPRIDHARVRMLTIAFEMQGLDVTVEVGEDGDLIVTLNEVP